MSIKRCSVCQVRDGRFLCDFVLGFEMAGVEKDYYGFSKAPHRNGKPISTHPVISFNSERFTCDRLLCGQCRVNEGHMFFCGGPDAGVVTIDKCPEHVGKDDHPLKILTHEEAVILRNRNKKRPQMELKL